MLVLWNAGDIYLPEVVCRCNVHSQTRRGSKIVKKVHMTSVVYRYNRTCFIQDSNVILWRHPSSPVVVVLDARMRNNPSPPQHIFLARSRRYLQVLLKRKIHWTSDVEYRTSSKSPNMPSLDHHVFRPLKTVISSSWIYPFKGIHFYATHRAWWPLFGRRLIPLIAVSILVFSFLFTFAYLPQVAFLALFHGPGAFLNALFLVLGEGQAIIALLFEALFVDETLVDVFDAVSCPIQFC